jgi:hypothetical protein
MSALSRAITRSARLLEECLSAIAAMVASCKLSDNFTGTMPSDSRPLLHTPRHAGPTIRAKTVYPLATGTKRA